MTASVEFRRVRRSVLLFGVVTALASLALVGCSGQGSAGQLNSPLAISTRNAVVSVENRAGQPLSDVMLTVIPFGGPEYSKSLSAMNSTERRDVRLGELASRDGVRFNAMLIRPKLVRVTAIVPGGQQLDVELPWR